LKAVEDLNQELATLKRVKHDETKKLELQIEGLKEKSNECAILSQRLDLERENCNRNMNNLQNEKSDLQSRELNCVKETSIAKNEKKECWNKHDKLEEEKNVFAAKASRLDWSIQMNHLKDQV
jgi:hypothetical protein